ncbi:MAG: hypothetical protein NZX77_15035 [Polyangiaceae bacterium]|nr:hypothetical protein [Polyangiaceae bacterium]
MAARVAPEAVAPAAPEKPITAAPAVAPAAPEKPITAAPAEEIDPGGGLPRYQVLMARQEEPSARSPLTYREVVYSVPAGTPEEDAEMLLRKLWSELAQQLWAAPPGKFLNLAVFDISFTGRPPRPPLVTLTWKDWRGPTPEITFPQRQRASQRPPSIGTIPHQQVVLPATAPLPSIPSEPPPSVTTPSSGPPTEIPPTALSPSSPEPTAVRGVPPHPSSVEVVLEEASLSSASPTKEEAAPPSPETPAVSALLPAKVPDVAETEASPSRHVATLPQAPTPAEPPPAEPAPATIGLSQAQVEGVRTEETQPLEPPTVHEAEPGGDAIPPGKSSLRETVEVGPEGPPPGVFGESSLEDPPPAAMKEARPTEPPSIATEEPGREMALSPGEAKEAKPAEASSSEVVEEVRSEAGSPREVTAEVPSSPRTLQVHGGIVTVEPFATSAQKTEGGPSKDARGKVVNKPRLSGDDLLSDLFEAMHDIHFQPGVLEGAHFVLSLAVEKIPCQVAICHLFDINRREFVITHVLGDCRKDLLLRRTSEKEPLIQQVMRRRWAVVLQGGDERLGGERWKRLGQPVVSAVVAPVVLGGRFLGLLELVNPVDREPFAEGDSYALAYIGEQFAEFLGQRGLMLDPEAIANFRPPNL